MASPRKTTGTAIARLRRWAKLSAAYSSGDHLAVSGHDALRALAACEQTADGQPSED